MPSYNEANGLEKMRSFITEQESLRIMENFQRRILMIWKQVIEI